MMITGYDYVLISDLHIGSVFSKTDLLNAFLGSIRKRTNILYLVGDVFDVWKSDIRTNDFSGMFDDFKQIRYVTGNHDSLIRNLQFISSNISEIDFFTHAGLRFYINHGHIFDASFGKESFFNFWADVFLYQVSKLIKVDIRAKFHFLTKYFYDKSFPEREKKILAGDIDKNFDFLITGHTHCPGENRINSLRLFNLGSWVQVPYAFFIQGDKYAFIEITADKLQPEEKDFSNFR